MVNIPPFSIIYADVTITEQQIWLIFSVDVRITGLKCLILNLKSTIADFSLIRRTAQYYSC